jgi:two-component system chemotaxis response regulator CheY
MEAVKNILVVDDSESIRELLAMTLESAGFKITKAEQGADALLQLEKQRFNLIVTDLHMPEMDGITLIKEVRKTDSHKFVPILLVTTENHNDKKIEAREAGATGWIVKPFQSEKLIHVVNKLMR